MPNQFLQILKFLFTRIAVIYLVIFIFIMTCIDIKTADGRIKGRRLNDNRPDFTQMVNFIKSDGKMTTVDWVPYKAYFEMVLRYIPDEYISKNILGFIYYQMGKEEKASVQFKSCAKLSAQMFWPSYNLGVMSYKKGNYEEALDYLLRAVNDKAPLALGFMQNSIVYRQIFANSAFDFNLNDRMQKTYADAYVLILSSLWNIKQYDKMQTIALGLITNSNLPSKDAFYYYTALSCLGLGQTEKAFVLLEKNIVMEKNNPWAYFYMAQIYQMAGKTKEAQELLKVFEALKNKNDLRFPYDKNVSLRIL